MQSHQVVLAMIAITVIAFIFIVWNLVIKAFKYSLNIKELLMLNSIYFLLHVQLIMGNVPIRLLISGGFVTKVDISHKTDEHKYQLCITCSFNAKDVRKHQQAD